jgi:NADH-quinone oxidoreductase subunit E
MNNSLLQELIEIQKKSRCISKESIEQLSEKLNIPAAKIYEVVTFYSFLSYEKKAKYFIRICNSPTCHLKRSENIITIFKKLLNAEIDTPTKDGKFIIQIASCIGCCDKSPAAMINDTLYINLNEEKIKEIIEKCK